MGQMISASLLGTLSKFSMFLIDFGMVYVAEAPIYEQGGKYFFTSDKDANGNIPGFNQSKPYTRFKGLGEMNAPQIYDAFLNPEKRRLIRVTPEGVERALDLARSLDERRQLLIDNGILTNPYNLK